MFCTVAMGRYFFEKRNTTSPLETFLVTAGKLFVPALVLINNNPEVFNISTVEIFSSPMKKEGFATLLSIKSLSRFLLPITRQCVLATPREDNLLACGQDFRHTGHH